MELHKAIKSVIETDGVEILKDVRLINILSDLQAFETMAACKYILRSIIVDGYTQKLVAIGAWNNQSENLCSQFVATTGFQPDIVNTVFQCLAYGLGWTIQITAQNQSGNQTQKPSPNNQQATQIIKLKTKEQREAFLLNKVEFLDDLKQELGVEATNMSFEMIDEEDKKCFNINYEIRGNLKKAKDFELYAAFYDNRNKIRIKEEIWFNFEIDSFRGFSIISHYIELPMPIEEVSRICIFIQYE